MEFRTKLVVKRKNKRAYVAYAGLGIAMSSLVLVFFPSMEDYLGWVFGTGIAIVVIGAIIAKGDVMNYGLSEEELVVSLDRILIGGRSYPMKQARKKEFTSRTYEGPDMNRRAMIPGSYSEWM